MAFVAVDKDPFALSPSDRDLLVRTALGEAENGSDADIADIAREVTGLANNGRSVPDIVFQRGRYSSWDTDARKLLARKTSSKAYQRVAEIVDKATSTDVPAPGSVLGRFGFTPEGASTGAAPAPAPASDNGPEPGSVLKMFGHDINAPELRSPVPRSAPAAAPIAPPANTRETFLQEAWDRLAGGMAKDVPKIAGGVSGLPGNILSSLIENFRGGVGAARQGAGEIRAGNVLPSFPSTDPRTWEPGGALRIAGGAAGAAFSPATALVGETVEKPVTQLTGNPDIGARAGVVANAVLSSKLLSAANKLRPQTRATGDIANVIEGAPPSDTAALTRLRENPRLTLADVDPTLRQRAMGIATEPGAAKNLLAQRIRERMSSAPEAVREAYTEAMGPAPNVIETLRGFRQTARENADIGFGKAFENASPVDVSPVLKAIDEKLSPGITGVATPGNALTRGPLQERLAEIRGTLTDGKSVVTDPQRLHEIQSELGREVRDLTTSATGSDKRLGRGLAAVQDSLVNQIDQATAGKYRPAREQYRTDMQVMDAFDKGSEVLQNRATKAGLREDTPDAWREWTANASPEELKAAQLGARSMIDQKIGGLRNAARQGTALPESDFNLQKFQILFGMKEATRLAKLLRDEKDIAETNAKLFAGSATAERLAGQEAVRVRPASPVSYAGFLPPTLAELGGIAAGMPELGHAAAVGTGALSALRFAQNRIGRAMDIRRNLLEAQMLTATGPEREAAIRRLQVEMNRPRNALATPSLPLTYTPPETRGGQ
jgi:hypothetical protein